MYIPQKDRAFWDQLVNPFINEVIGGSKGPPSQSGLTYALSRIVWAIYNRFPTGQVASGLRAVLTDVRNEFTRRKLETIYAQQIYQEGDLPEGNKQDGPISSGNFLNSATIAQADSPLMKVITLSDLSAHLEAGGTFESLIEQTPVMPIKITPPAPKPSLPGKMLKFPLIIDPAAEDDAEKRHLRAIKAFAIAQQAKAKPEIIQKLAQAVSDTLVAYLETLGMSQ